MTKTAKIKLITSAGVRTVNVLRKNLKNYKQDKRYKGKVYKQVKKLLDIKSRTDKFKSELTGLEGKRITFRIRQDVLAKDPTEVIERLKFYFKPIKHLYPSHPYIRFIITLVGVKQSTQKKERFGISTPNQDRSPRSEEELWDAMHAELSKFYLEESPDWEYLTATRFIIRFSRRYDDNDIRLA